MNNVSKLDKKFCTGCSACLNVCPVGAIEMKTDENGFSHPFVNDKCVNCGLCEKTCPSLSEKLHLNKEPKCFAVWANDKKRASGSSGGVFACLAEHIIDEGGVVYGAAFEKGCRKLKHIAINTKIELPKIYKSKYVQSEVGEAFADVKKNLENDKPVLFSGTPCQVDGLKAYLGKDYDNLFTVDILCHGVPSPMAFNKFLDEVAKGREIVSVDFRDKKHGWGTLISVTFADGSVHYDYYNGNYFRAFLSGLSMRESCLSCKYAQPNRVGDITLGDFWGVQNFKKEWNDGKGTSLVLCNSKKGLNLFNAINSDIAKKEQVGYKTVVEISTKANAALVRPTYPPEMRKCFFYHLKKGDSFSQSVRYAEKSLMDVGILGWWIATDKSNYGSSLTCYALYEYISSLGLSTAFISPPGFDRAKAGKFNYENGYRMTAKYDQAHMNENNKYFDAFVVGSDVLWYYNAMIASGYMFMLDFVDDSKKKISYSTSFGNTKSFIPDSEMFKAKSLLKRFDHVAVREYEAVDILKNKFDIEATHVLDPVFLPDMSSWNKLANRAETKTQGKFMFVYMLDPDERKAKALIDFANKKKLKIVSITDKQFNPEYKNEVLKNCGVLKGASINDFVYHIMNAEFVVTDSYHGFCFSLLFKRQFATLVNRTRGGSRFDTLSALLGVKERMIEDISELSMNPKIMENFDYTDCSKILERETERCQKWLQNAIFSDKVPKKLSEQDLLVREVAQLRDLVNNLNERLSKFEEKK